MGVSEKVSREKINYNFWCCISICVFVVLFYALGPIFYYKGGLHIIIAPAISLLVLFGGPYLVNSLRKRINEKPPSKEPEFLVCPQCKLPVDKDEKICSNCGKQIS